MLQVNSEMLNIGERGPEFEIAELHGVKLKRFRVKAGYPGCEYVGEANISRGILRDEGGFRIRAIELDHGTPILAFAFEPQMQVNVRKDRLKEYGLEPDQWLTELKRKTTGSDLDGSIELPGGRQVAARAIAASLLITAPGERLVYATDLADTKENREKLIHFAKYAHTFFLRSAVYAGR